MIAPIMMTYIYRDQTISSPSKYLNKGFTADQAIELYKISSQESYIQWNPLTLQAGGFFHIAMGGVLGIGSWTRGKEKEALAKK